MSNTATAKPLPNQGQLEPTLYTLQGYDIQISYATTTISGEPQFIYNNGTESRTFTSSGLRIEETGLGRSVTVLLENNEVDQGFLSFTLLLPAVQLSDDTRQVSIQTLAILNRRFIRVVPGARQLQNYNPVSLTGIAQYVIS